MNKLSFGCCFVAVLWLCAGCGFSERKQCAKNSDCPSGSSCELGFCASNSDTAANGGKGGRSSTNTSNSQTPGEEGGGGAQTGTTANPAMVSPGQGGAGGSRNTPTGRDAGMAMDANMSMTPPVAMGDCKSTDAPRSCTKAAGCEGTQRCVGTSWGECEAPADRLNKAETCNGVDDNCNGVVDDLPAVQRCYPPGMVGCTQNADGSFACKGKCGVGTQECANGKLGECLGAKTPQPEVCQVGGSVAEDEDCNGTADDTCECTEDKSCYTGGGMSGIGECRPGKQTCTAGKLSMQCVGQVLDSLEVCNGKDDDCNGMTDDVIGVGSSCVTGAKGICMGGIRKCMSGSATTVCVANSVATTEVCNGMDDDCNGTPDDVPGLQTNASMCGGCGKPACTAAASSCCAGGCVDLQTDAKNCGMCGKPCPTGDSCVGGLCKAPVMGGAGASGSSGGAGASGMMGGGGASGAGN